MDSVEREFLSRVWFAVARSEDVNQNPVASKLLGEDLVIYRTDSGLTIAKDQCPHRGAKLSDGSLEDGTLECPYHGWRYGGKDGKCMLVPSMPEDSPAPDVALKTYRAAEKYGYIWCCLSEPLLEVPMIEPLDQEEWTIAHGHPHDLACGIRLLTENFRDMSHFPFVHRGTMGPNVRREVARYRVNRKGWTLSWVLPTDLGGTSFGGNRALASEQTMTYNLVLPAISFIVTDFPDGGRRVSGQLATPLNDEGDETRQFWFVGLNEVVMGHPGASIAEMFKFEKLVLEEDWAIVEGQRPREAPLDLQCQAHTRADNFSVVYRETYRELLDLVARRSERPSAQAVSHADA